MTDWCHSRLIYTMPVIFAIAHIYALRGKIVARTLDGVLPVTIDWLNVAALAYYVHNWLGRWCFRLGSISSSFSSFSLDENLIYLIIFFFLPFRWHLFICRHRLNDDEDHGMEWHFRSHKYVCIIYYYVLLSVGVCKTAFNGLVMGSWQARTSRESFLFFERLCAIQRKFFMNTGIIEPELVFHRLLTSIKWCV